MNLGEELQCNLVLFQGDRKRRINGSVTISSNRPVKFKETIIEIYGVAECFFKLEQSKIMFPHIHFKGKNLYGRQQFYFVRQILEKNDYSVNVRPKNIITYNFSVRWPNRLPQSWKGDHGHIKYIGKLILTCDELSHIHVQELIVSPNRNLNLESHLLFEGRVDVKRKFSLNKNDYTTVSLWIPISGIAIGQSLPVVCTINNKSKVHFSGLVFVLTRIDIYRSCRPISLTKTVRTDVCRVARMVHILQGKYIYFAILKTDSSFVPTNQYYKCQACQVVYEVWISVQGNFPRYKGLGYPNIDTPGIPVIIGTESLINYKTNVVTNFVLEKIYYNKPVAFQETLIRDEEVEEVLINAEEHLDEETISNLMRQLQENEKAINEMIDETSSDDDFIPTTAVDILE